MTHLNVITIFSTMMSSKMAWKIFSGKISYLKIISRLAWPLIFFSSRLVLYLTNMHYYINFPKKKYFKTKPRIHKGIQFSMEKRDKLLKIYCNESDSILKATKQNNFKIVIPYVISKIKESKKQYYQRYSQKYSTNVKKIGMELDQLLL